MRAYQFDRFDLASLTLRDVASPPAGRGEVVVDVRAMSLNYRDLLVIRGLYNPKFKLPATPISDGSGIVTAVGDGVSHVKIGDRVVTHFVTGWQDGELKAEYLGTTLGLPLAGMAAERVVLPAHAVVPIPAGLDFAEAATLPIAALTAWSALVTEGNLQPGQTVLTLGTGGVSVFALQFAKAMGARVIITSSSDEKLARARTLEADETVNYKQTSEWDRRLLELTGGRGVDLTVENGGIQTLDQSLRSTRAGGVIAMLGAVTGLQGPVNIAACIMKRIRIAGVMVDSLAGYKRMLAFLVERGIRPVIDRRFDFDELPAALGAMQSGGHFGKIVITREC